MSSKPDKPDYEGIGRVLREKRGVDITAKQLAAEAYDDKEGLVQAVAHYIGVGWQVEVFSREGDRVYCTLEQVATDAEASNWHSLSSSRDWVTPEDVEAHCEWIDRVQDAQVTLINLRYDHDDFDVQAAEQALDYVDWEDRPDALEALVKAAQAASTD